MGKSLRTALVLGGAKSVWNDVMICNSQFHHDGVVACNEAGLYWDGRLDGWCTLHTEKFENWRKLKSEKLHGGVENYFVPRDASVGVERAIRTGHKFPDGVYGGSSGMFAAKIALIDLGYDRVILCGCPMDASSHFFDREEWRAFNGFRRAWVDLSDSWKNKIASMSGWTNILLGGIEKWGDHDQELHEERYFASF